MAGRVAYLCTVFVRTGKTAVGLDCSECPRRGQSEFLLLDRIVQQRLNVIHGEERSIAAV